MPSKPVSNKGSCNSRAQVKVSLSWEHPKYILLQFVLYEQANEGLFAGSFPHPLLEWHCVGVFTVTFSCPFSQSALCLYISVLLILGSQIKKCSTRKWRIVASSKQMITHLRGPAWCHNWPSLIFLYKSRTHTTRQLVEQSTCPCWCQRD